MDSLIRNISNQNLQDFFFHKISSFSSNEEALNYLIPENGYADFTGLNKLGEAELSDGDLLVFSCKYNGELSERTAKKKQYELAKKALKEDFKDGAIFVFYDNAGHFRFSFIQRNYDDEHQKYTPYKRYTYYVDPQKQNKTFRRRVGDGDFRSLKAIQKAFSVEPLSKQFYKELSHWYFAALGEVQFPNDRNENEYNLHANAMIRLITRLMFVWFMKQKGLVPQDFFDKEKLDELLNYKDSTNSTYYKAILQNLFFATLNTPMGEKRKWVTTSGYGVQNFYRYKRFFQDPEAFLELTKDIPFLNGGLFENLDIVQTADPGKGIEKKDIRLDCFSDNPKNEGRLTVPDYLFFGTRKADISGYFEDNSKTDVEINGIIDILNRYDFTIDENTPEDQDVALDPELLGTVFENLLASYNPETQSTARKESGSFYTPRPIVDYMVKESIFYFLREKVDTNEDILKQLLHEEEPPAITDEERAPIIEALSSMTVLDPACGSGAFPMGGLQQIVRLLNILDPDNRHWKQAQIKLLQEQTQQAFENQSELEELKARIDEIFANNLSNPDFKRKLFLIQNCLYGADIQPIAMQITKLRFFISLLVEQQIDRSKDNHGILSLPNLETRFVAANTLIRPDKQQGTFKNVKIQILEEELHQIRERYFSARTPKTKRKYRTRDLEIRQQIAGLLQNDGFAEDVATKIAHWDPFNPNSKAEWFEPEWMFGISAFDVVIGNPPYKQVKKKTFSKINFPYSEGKDKGKQNLYKLFVEASYNLAIDNGISCMIVQSSLLGDLSSTHTRELLLTKSKICQILEFPKKAKKSSAQVFSSVLQGTCIYISRKVKPDESFTMGISITNDVLSISDPTFEYLKQLQVLKIYPDAFYIPLISKGYSKIISKLPNVSTVFNAYIKEIYQGDLNLTSSKKYFCKNDTGVKLYRGKHIQRFLLKTSVDEWVQPAHKADQVMENSENEFLVFQEITGTTDRYRIHCCCTVKGHCYLFGHTANKVRLKNQSLNKVFLAFMNSKFMDWFFRITSTNNHVMGYELKQLPIPKNFKSSTVIIDRLVDTICKKKAVGENTTPEEAKIDLIVYKLYGLSYEEVMIVDSEFEMNAEEYEGFDF